MVTPRKTSIEEVKFALISILVRTLQSIKEESTLERELRTKSLFGQRMQTRADSITSGFEKGVGGEEQEAREYPIINGGDELPRDAAARETLVTVRRGETRVILMLNNKILNYRNEHPKHG